MAECIHGCLQRANQSEHVWLSMCRWGASVSGAGADSVCVVGSE